MYHFHYLTDCGWYIVGAFPLYWPYWEPCGDGWATYLREPAIGSLLWWQFQLLLADDQSSTLRSLKSIPAVGGQEVDDVSLDTSRFLGVIDEMKGHFSLFFVHPCWCSCLALECGIMLKLQCDPLISRTIFFMRRCGGPIYCNLSVFGFLDFDMP